MSRADRDRAGIPASALRRHQNRALALRRHGPLVRSDRDPAAIRVFHGVEEILRRPADVEIASDRDIPLRRAQGQQSARQQNVAHHDNIRALKREARTEFARQGCR